MEKANHHDLTITADPELLNEGSPEERAGFASVSLRCNGVNLAEGRDGFLNKIRRSPLLSGYHLAEWLAWNWWRLRWEPRSNLAGWEFAHQLTTIGEGYVWPNVTIFSDGKRVACIAKPTPERAETRFRYICDALEVVSASEFEYASEAFIEQVRGLLRDAGLADSNLDRTWQDVQAERKDPALNRSRKFEALLGRDPDVGDPDALKQLTSDVQALGESAADEIAANYPYRGELFTHPALIERARQDGFDFCPADAVRLKGPGIEMRPSESVPAWSLGAAAAKALRQQEHLNGEPIESQVLANLAGVQLAALKEPGHATGISFLLKGSDGAARVVLRSGWATGRRFELARLLGDRLLQTSDEPLHPATRAHTYRQKMQRSFAAELLSPFESVMEALQGDFSSESQQEVAERFKVSELTIRTLLVNHHCLERDETGAEFDYPSPIRRGQSPA